MPGVVDRRRWFWLFGGGAAAVLTACVAYVACAAPAFLPCGERCEVQPGFLLQRIYPGETEENYVAQVMAPFRAADRDNNGLDRGDIEFIRKKEQAQRRAQRISSVLMYDLDGDLRVTRAEIIASASQFNPTFAASQADRLMAQYDLNHDEIIDIHEVASAPEPVRYGPSYDQAGRLEQMLALGGGSRLSATTLAHIAQRTFEKVDTDRNGQISQAEYQAIQPDRTGYSGALPLQIPPAPNRHHFP